MRVWLITIGEPLPTDNTGHRLLRTGILADMMSGNGHDVVFWSSTFNHVLKCHRARSDLHLDVNESYQIRPLHGVGYSANISLRRLLNHRGVAAKFRKQAPAAHRPDVILCSLPTLELCVEATTYGHRYGVPVVLDVRDQWPDLFLDLLPWGARHLARLALSPMFRDVRRACSRAAAITGVTREFVQWGLGHANRQCGPLDRPFPMGYVEKTPSQREIHDAEDFWNSHGISLQNSEFVACFFGTIGRHFEIDPLIRAAKILAASGRRIRWVICGSGEHLDRCRQLAVDCQNILFPGWIDAAKIWMLMRISHVGLAPYVSSENFVTNLPNKPIEYLSAGLPIVSSLRGVLADLLLLNDCGVTYANRQVDQIVQALEALYDDPRRLKAMSANACALYQDQFIAENVYAQMQDYLLEVADGRPHVAAA